MTEKATFAAGCFWGVEAEFRKTKGVLKTQAGYTGGTVANPAYALVSTGLTGHAESVEVEYDPKVVSYDQLLDVFWSLHDPTQANRQGPDVGTQYRSAIFYHNEKQKKAALTSKGKIQQKYKLPVATEIVPAKEFYRAEEYHQQYLEKNKGASCHL